MKSHFYREEELEMFGWRLGRRVDVEFLSKGDLIFVEDSSYPRSVTYQLVLITQCSPPSVLLLEIWKSGQLNLEALDFESLPSRSIFYYAIPFSNEAANSYTIANKMRVDPLVPFERLQSDDYRVSWVYSILRDYCPAGEVEALVRQVCRYSRAYEAFELTMLLAYPELEGVLDKDKQMPTVKFTNSFLAEYAKNIVERLTRTV